MNKILKLNFPVSVLIQLIKHLKLNLWLAVYFCLAALLQTQNLLIFSVMLYLCLIICNLIRLLADNQIHLDGNYNLTSDFSKAWYIESCLESKL